MDKVISYHSITHMLRTYLRVEIPVTRKIWTKEIQNIFFGDTGLTEEESLLEYIYILYNCTV